MPEFRNIAPIPTGGAIGMQVMLASGDWTLSRATSGDSGLSTFTEIASGTMPASGSIYHIDTGDALPGPLPPTAYYVYQATDSTGLTQSAPIEPVSQIELLQDGMTEILISLMQGGLNSMSIPPGINRAKVRNAMPTTGFPPLPFVVLYPEMLQQEEVPIGKDVITPDQITGIAVNTELAKRMYRVSILSENAVEREFYRDAVIAFFKAWLSSFFSAIGNDVRQRYVASSYQVSGDTTNQSPGFYGCDVMIEITGTYNIAIVTSYGIIEHIVAEITESSFENGPTVIDTVEVPLASG